MKKSLIGSFIVVLATSAFFAGAYFVIDAIDLRHAQEVAAVASASFHNGSEADLDYLKAKSDEAAIAPTAGTIFYTKRSGVYGSSFIDSNLKAFLADYFKLNSNILDLSFDYRIITINTSRYLMKNIPFTGIDNTQTGALIFVPILAAKYILMISVCSSLVMLFLLSYLKHRHSGILPKAPTRN